jgi:hypothetical protein
MEKRWTEQGILNGKDGFGEGNMCNFGLLLLDLESDYLTAEAACGKDWT